MKKIVILLLLLTVNIIAAEWEFKQDFSHSAKKINEVVVDCSFGTIECTQSTDNNISVKTTSGDVKVFGLKGNLKHVSTSGDLKADDISGSVTAESTSGDLTFIRLNDKKADYTISSISGDINLEGN